MKPLGKYAWISLVLLASASRAAPPPDPYIKTELRCVKTAFQNHEPIIVEVYTQNTTNTDLERDEFSFSSSSVGMPEFHILQVPDGKQCTIPVCPWGYFDEWKEWYVLGFKTGTGRSLTLPARKRMNLLYGDLRWSIAVALSECRLRNPKTAEETNQNKDNIDILRNFLQGGTFDVSVHAYSISKPVRITIAPPDKVLNQWMMLGDDPLINTKLKIQKTFFQNEEPIIFDVYMQNITHTDFDKHEFCSSIGTGLPTYNITRLPDGKKFSLPMCFWNDKLWYEWYQLEFKSGFPGSLNLPAKRVMHLLHGDLRADALNTIKCGQAWIVENYNAKEINEMMAYAKDFLQGGTFEVFVHAYSLSNSVRITIAPPKNTKTNSATPANTK